jgi:hypothetical protein
MADRPLVKNGEANISMPLRRYKRPVALFGMAAMNATATSPRIMSLASMTRRRSARSRSTPARGPAASMATARESMMPLTTSPDFVFAMARLKTAMLLK